MPILEKCCCCSLKSGVIILGVLSLIFPVILGAISILSLLGSGIFAAVLSSDQTREAFKQDCLKNNETVTGDVCENETNGSIYFAWASVGFGTLLVISAFYVAVSSCLIHGARKGHHCLLIPYMVVVVVSVLFEIAVVIFAAVDPYNIGTPTFSYVVVIMAIIIHIFIFLVVFSLSQKIRQNPEPSTFQQTQYGKTPASPIPDYQPPPTNYQPTPNIYQPPQTTYQPPPTNYQPSPSNYYQQPPSNQPPSIYPDLK